MVASPAARLRSLAVLFKVRIVGLLLAAGAGGAFLAAGGWPGVRPLALMTLTGGLAAMGASALNQHLEQREDAAMRRTRRRPLVTGAFARPGWVPVAGLALIFAPSLTVLPFNPALAFFSIGGAVIYAGVYTLWLKPRTVTNIVIGGAAGTCAVLSGGAAVGPAAGAPGLALSRVLSTVEGLSKGLALSRVLSAVEGLANGFGLSHVLSTVEGLANGWAEPGVIVLGLLVFLWTPMHFWSLALLYREDYARAGVPMLPAVLLLITAGSTCASPATAWAARTGRCAMDRPSRHGRSRRGSSFRTGCSARPPASRLRRWP